ncbi:hypothetical protein, partial [Streptomyces sp. URMC 123]|uniref:hypothetical protein n=1 Tax=Streptomyces sp. URMC 123 TaxID=3423403 RepID=UPI003F1CDCF2
MTTHGTGSELRTGRATAAPGGTEGERPSPPHPFDSGPEADAVLLARALADARSPRPVGPDTPAGPARPRWGGRTRGVPGRRPGDAVDLDQLLRHSLAADPAAAGGERGRLRPHPSAGALHPVRAHLLVGAGCPVPPGRYAYEPLGHRLTRRGPGPTRPAPGLVVVLTVIARRTAAHYGHRAWPLLLLDAGHAAAAVALAALGHGCAAEVCLDSGADLLAAAAGLPAPGAWPDSHPGTPTEHPLAAVRVTPRSSGAAQDAPADPYGARGGARPVPGHRTGAGPLAPWAELPPASALVPHGLAPDARTCRTDAVLRALTRTTAAPPSWWAAGPPRTVASPSVLRAALAARRSAAPPLAGEPGPDRLAAVLAAAASACPDGPHWCVATGGPRPGLYVLGGARRPHDPLGSHDGPVLRRIADGEARPTLAAWAAGQAWLADAGAVLLAHSGPNGAGPTGAPGRSGAVAARRVRADHLAAGYAIGHAQLVAGVLGLRSRPVGSWQQADLGAALGGAPGQDWVLHGLALGTGGTPAAADRPAADRTAADRTAADRTAADGAAAHRTAAHRTDSGTRAPRGGTNADDSTDPHTDTAQDTGATGTDLGGGTDGPGHRTGTGRHHPAP